MKSMIRKVTTAVGIAAALAIASTAYAAPDRGGDAVDGAGQLLHRRSGYRAARGTRRERDRDPHGSTGGPLTAKKTAAQKLTHWCIVPGFANDGAVADGNSAVAFTEFGSYIATAMIASASFGGGEGSWLTAIVFFALGQLALIAGFWAQERLLPALELVNVAPFDKPILDLGF